ncbi:Hydrolyzes glycerol-phospholipids at the terminal phosphodiesteric bond [Stylosanthes scabra]|uniref:Hydrolyzes glycerol-phospholipids at the terminal phosphodiesteric bond n=1 Tax=Stylosanthes scabra TaxID=79078 RepID=A0ABU6XR70_9FABA|nr:Hydrolyzes glycerol-phospholipids at the terminal phosphodiesteric bond [Stylosanthes scabra]
MEEGVLLHGDMDVTICPTSNLKAVIDNASVEIESRRVKDPSNPKQEEESFYIRCAHKASNIILTIRSERFHFVGRDVVIGYAQVPVKDVYEDIKNGGEVSKWVEIVDRAKKAHSWNSTDLFQATIL